MKVSVTYTYFKNWLDLKSKIQRQLIKYAGRLSAFLLLHPSPPHLSSSLSHSPLTRFLPGLHSVMGGGGGCITGLLIARRKLLIHLLQYTWCRQGSFPPLKFVIGNINPLLVSSQTINSGHGVEFWGVSDGQSFNTWHIFIHPPPLPCNFLDTFIPC